MWAQKNLLVVSLLPEEWLSHSVVGWLSASLSLVVPSEWANRNAGVNSESLELDSADLCELVSSLFAGGLAGLAISSGLENLGLLGLWLDAVVVILLVTVWALHGAVAASDSDEKGITLGLEGCRVDLLAVVLSVGSLASGLGWGKVQLAVGDSVLDLRRQVVVQVEEGLGVVGSSSGKSLVVEDAGEALVLAGGGLGESTGDDKCENKNSHVLF